MLPLLDVQLSDALPMQSYPSKVWVLCQCGRAYLCASQLICIYIYIYIYISIYFSTWNRWYIMANTLKMLISQLSNVQFTSWIWFSAEGWLYKLWDMLFLFWSGFCMAESWARRLSLCLACKPFPGLCACTRTGRWCAWLFIPASNLLPSLPTLLPYIYIYAVPKSRNCQFCVTGKGFADSAYLANDCRFREMGSDLPNMRKSFQNLPISRNGQVITRNQQICPLLGIGKFYMFRIKLLRDYQK